jgi:hypothetical protein
LTAFEFAAACAAEIDGVAGAGARIGPVGSGVTLVSALFAAISCADRAGLYSTVVLAEPVAPFASAVTLIVWLGEPSRSDRLKLPPLTVAGRPPTITFALAGVTLPVTTTSRTPSVAPLIGVVIETLTGCVG